MRIGLPSEYFEGLDPEIAGRITEAAHALARQGAHVEPVSLPHTRFGVSAYYLLATAEASSNLARYDGVRYGRRETADGLRETYRRTRRAGFGDEVQRRIMLGTFALSAGYRDEFYGTAQRARALVLADFLALFRSGVDAILAPVAPTTAFRLGEKVDDPLAMYLSDAFTVPASLAGLPGLSVPVGRDRAGLPIGAQILAAHFREGVLLRAGAALERELWGAGTA
jgi:aspartyl-tRNA(Asn)/glutamyl-tRNA(Gln) amidotransferase subunit A